MANPHKGDTPLAVGEKTYTLCYSHMALSKLEERLGKGIVPIMEELQASQRNLKIGTVIALLWAGLQKHHPAISYEDAADILDQMDTGAAGAMEAIGQSFEKAFPAPGTKGTNPPMNGSVGTGINSLLSTPATVTTLTPSGISPPEN